MANSFEVDIAALDEAALWEMLKDFPPGRLVTLYFEHAADALVVGLTDDIRGEQAAAELAAKAGAVSDHHLARWLNWAEVVHETQSSAMDRSGDVDDLLNEDEL